MLPSQLTYPGPAGQVWSWFTALQVLPLHETHELKSPQSAVHVALVGRPPGGLGRFFSGAAAAVEHRAGAEERVGGVAKKAGGGVARALARTAKLRAAIIRHLLQFRCPCGAGKLDSDVLVS